MKCPYCTSTETKVVDKRDSIDTGTTRRRRECLKCSKRFTTYERVENIDLNIQKKDGSIEAFNREKLKKGMMKAIKKDEVSEELLNQILDNIETKLLSKESTLVKSVEIGDLVLAEFKQIHPVVYMRFASVYKGFSSLEDFERELNLLKKVKGKT
jgi:transcriptional repressor NrdR